MKIVILDGYGANPGDLSWEPLKQFGELEVYPRTAPDEVLERAKDADIVLTNKVVLDKDKICLLKKLKYIGVIATGYNVVDIDEARKQGIIVTNIPAYSTESVAQMTFAHILNIANRVDYYAAENRKGRWSSNPDFCYWDTSLPELSGKTFGIIGLGSIGKRVAQIAKAFGMTVYAYTSKRQEELPEGVKKAELNDLLAVSDILSLHCPLTDTTREIINKDSLSRMKHGAILINTGRGPLINDQDVAEALSSGRLAGYGADVMCTEPPAADNPLLSQKNAFITPHIAWATVEARSRLMEITIDNIRKFVDGHPQNVVNN